MDKNERRICWYSCILIVLMVNTPKLLALRDGGIVSRYWHFNLSELLFQITFNLLFCWLILYLNLSGRSPLITYRHKGRILLYSTLNGFLFLLCAIIGGVLQHHFWGNIQIQKIFWLGYFTRIGLSLLLTGILAKILLLLRDAKKRDMENEQLKNAYMASELELLKEQMNPHFLFNALSSLSGVIRENPELAQKYVRELSNVFRYSLMRTRTNLVTVEEELAMLRSFAQIITMRLEGAFQLRIKVDPGSLPFRLPHLSLQPLLENAVKHNTATLHKPLRVDVYIYGSKLIVSNTLSEIGLPETSNGLGLSNLNERYKIMMQQEIEIVKSSELFTVKLPLKP